MFVPTSLKNLLVSGVFGEKVIIITHDIDIVTHDIVDIVDIIDHVS